MRHTLWVLQAHSQQMPVTADLVKGMPELLLVWKNCDLNHLIKLAHPFMCEQKRTE